MLSSFDFLKSLGVLGTLKSLLSLFCFTMGAVSESLPDDVMFKSVFVPKIWDGGDSCKFPEMEGTPKSFIFFLINNSSKLWGSPIFGTLRCTWTSGRLLFCSKQIGPRIGVEAQLGQRIKLGILYSE